MYILFKHYGLNRFYKRFNTVEELREEIGKGFNPKFPGNCQFHFDTESKDIVILNKRLSLDACQEELTISKIY
jgi:hypothetical protein